MKFQQSPAFAAPRPTIGARTIERGQSFVKVQAPLEWTTARVESWLDWRDALPGDYPAVQWPEGLGTDGPFEPLLAEGPDRWAQRLASWGWALGVFDAPDDALAFRRELFNLLARGLVAPGPSSGFGARLHPLALDPVTAPPISTPKVSSLFDGRTDFLSVEPDGVHRRLASVCDAVTRCDGALAACVDPAVNHALSRAVLDARVAGASDPQIADVMALAAAGHTLGFDATAASAKVLVADRSALVACESSAKDAARIGWERGDCVLAFSQEDAAAIVRSALAPSAAVNVALMTDDEDLEAAVRLVTLALDIDVSVGFAQTAADSCYRRDHRPIALCLAGVSERLVSEGLAFSDAAGRDRAAALHALVAGAAYAVSSAIAEALGPYPAFAEERESRLAELERYAHSAAALNQNATSRRAFDLLAEARQQGGAIGLRNAQILTGDGHEETAMRLGALSLGVAPWQGCKSLAETADGRVFATLDAFAVHGLLRLGVDIDEARVHALGYGALDGAPGVNHESLKKMGFTAHEITAAESALTTANTMRAAFSPAVLGAGFVRDVLGADDDSISDPAFDSLVSAGFSADEIEAAEAFVFGAGTLSDAPFIAPECRTVFEGINEISIDARLAMIVAIQAFTTAPPVAILPLKFNESIDAAMRCSLSRPGTASALCDCSERVRRQVSASSCRSPNRSRTTEWSRLTVSWSGWSRWTETAASCRIDARDTSRRQVWAATRFISTRASSTTASLAKSSSTCTRKAPRSALS